MVFADTTDEDGDGLTAFDEVFKYRSNPKVADSNDDGLSDGVLATHGISPNTNLQPLFETVIEETRFRAGGVLVEKVGDKYQIKLTIQKSDDLKAWIDYHEETILIDAVDGKQFLRVKVE